jgi:hypothetical protein
MDTASATRSEAEVALMLAEFERRYDAFGLTVEGISLWRILRFEISYVMQKLGLPRLSASGQEIIATTFHSMRQIVTAPREIEYLGATMNSALRIFDERGWHDVYFDAMMDQIGGGAKMLYADARGFEDNVRHAYRKPMFNDTAVVVFSSILGRLFPVRGDDAAFDKLSGWIVSDLSLADFTPDRIRQKFSVLKWRTELYRLVFKRLGPKSLLVPNSGQFALFLAANGLGIPFVEMQHGIFSETHPDNLPAYALERSNRALLLPDLLTVYGDYWAEKLRDSALGRLGRIRPVGAPLIDSSRALRQRCFAADPAKPILTLTSQGGFSAERAVEFVKAFLGIYSGPLLVNVRLHPGYEAGSSPFDGRFVDDHRVVLWRGNRKPDTYQMIAMSDLHLSIYSACHFEALGIGTPTAILALPGHELMLDLAARGDAILVESPERLAELVRQRGWGAVSTQISDHYFRRDHIASLKAVLAECASMRGEGGQ